jgi:hypothetical protein
VRLFDKKLAIATVDLNRCYIGQRVRIAKKEGGVAEFEIVKRFSGRTIAVARCVAAGGPVEIETGASVTPAKP